MGRYFPTTAAGLKQLGAAVRRAWNRARGRTGDGGIPYLVCFEGRSDTAVTRGNVIITLSSPWHSGTYKQAVDLLNERYGTDTAFLISVMRVDPE